MGELLQCTKARVQCFAKKKTMSNFLTRVMILHQNVVGPTLVIGFLFTSEHQHPCQGIRRVT